MLLLIVVWTLMAAAAVACGMKWSLPGALGTWAVLTAVLCAGGAFLMQLQPIGVSTPSGRVGSSFVQWGFDVGGGQLLPATAISWLIWNFLGAAVIALTKFRAQPQSVGMILAWTADIIALLYTLGVLSSNRRRGMMSSSLVSISAVLVVMIGGSAALWWFVGTQRARVAALALAAGPTLFIGLGYGFFVLVMVIVGQHARAN